MAMKHQGVMIRVVGMSQKRAFAEISIDGGKTWKLMPETDKSQRLSLRGPRLRIARQPPFNLKKKQRRAHDQR